MYPEKLRRGERNGARVWIGARLCDKPVQVRARSELEARVKLAESRVAAARHVWESTSTNVRAINGPERRALNEAEAELKHAREAIDGAGL
jgi:hypothetical protein